MAFVSHPSPSEDSQNDLETDLNIDNMEDMRCIQIPVIGH